MKILVLGADGYLGYPLARHLLEREHFVMGVDDRSRRRRVSEIGSDSLTPIPTFTERKTALRSEFPRFAGIINCTLGDDGPGYIQSILESFQPDCIVHLAEQPSAPWSMIDTPQARETQRLNVIGTLDLLWAMRYACPEAHLVKLGTMGEYGTPNCRIPEGSIPDRCLDQEQYYPCPMAGLPFPRSPGSFYHLSKVHDTHNIIFACKTWGLRSTDIMQGVVFGVKLDGNTEESHLTRFDYDQYFGTVINRFCAQAIIGHDLTVYGEGRQTRGFLSIKESITCLTLSIENPPYPSVYRTFNQFGYLYSVDSLAKRVMSKAKSLGLHVGISYLENPRVEKERHIYETEHHNLTMLGYRPTEDIDREIFYLLQDIIQYRGRVRDDVILPSTTWR